MHLEKSHFGLRDIENVALLRHNVLNSGRPMQIARRKSRCLSDRV
jgi:hypothetical protein